MLSLSPPKRSQEAITYFAQHLRPREEPPNGTHPETVDPGDASPGQWFGAGAKQLGLTGDVGAEDLASLLIGFSPGRYPLVQNAASADRRAAWDLVLSSPKSVSVIWALGPAEIAAALDTAHQQAAEETFQQMEDRYAIGRRGKAGRRKEPVQLVTALFCHHTSRENDPQLHTHGLVPNLALFRDGHWGALEPRPLFQATLELGLYFRQALARHLQPLGLPLEWEGDLLRIAGVPRELEVEFSQRRRQVEERLAMKPFRSAKAKEIAVLETRAPKRLVPIAELRREWRVRAESFSPELEFLNGSINIDVPDAPASALVELADPEMTP